MSGNDDEEVNKQLRPKAPKLTSVLKKNSNHLDPDNDPLVGLFTAIVGKEENISCTALSTERNKQVAEEEADVSRRSHMGKDSSSKHNHKGSSRRQTAPPVPSFD